MSNKWRLCLPFCLLLIAVYTKAQQQEFDIAYQYIKHQYPTTLQNLEENCGKHIVSPKPIKYKYAFVVNGDVVKGDFDYYLYLQDKISKDSLEGIFHNDVLIQKTEKSLFKSAIKFDPKTSKYWNNTIYKKEWVA